MLFAFKGKINNVFHSDLICKFVCNICNDSQFRKTKRYFEVRDCEHLGITFLAG